MSFRFLSLFSGIEAASVAWKPLGWECVAVAEVEPFPCSVLAHHYPHVPNLGDVTKITQEQIQSLGRIDAVVFGFPCQDLSIAGKRAGLHDENGKVTRSGLFFDAMRIVRWSGARWAIAENVPGLFSHGGGLTFAAVAGEMAGVQPDVPKGGWQNSGFLAGPDGLVEWAVLDAQFFGVPQRRRRVFLVLDSGDWAGRPPLLLDRESLLGNPPPRREARQTAPTIPARSLGGGGLGTDFDCDGGLDESAVSLFTTSSHGNYKEGTGTLRGSGGDYGGLAKTSSHIWPADVAPTLNAAFGDKQGLEDQHALNGGGGLFVPALQHRRGGPLSKRWRDGTTGLRDGDANLHGRFL